MCSSLVIIFFVNEATVSNEKSDQGGRGKVVRQKVQILYVSA